ncbi:MAG: phosphatase PAP2 family protein [Bacteroidota bacterium]
MNNNVEIIDYIKHRNLAQLTLCLCIILFSVQTAFAQSPYSLSKSKDIPIIIGETALFGLTIGLNKKSPELSPDDTIGLDIMNIPAIDRKIVYNWSKRAQRQSDVLLHTSPIAPLAFPLVAGNNSRKELGVTYVIAFEGMLASYTLTELTKLIVKRKRPYVYGKSDFRGNLFGKESWKSFFSGHTAFTATNYYMAAKMFNDFYPDSNWRPVVWSTAAIVPAITAWKRVQGGKHFVTDVVVGYVVGAAVGILIPEIHRR